MSLSPSEQAAILTQVSEANLPCAELVVKLVTEYQTMSAMTGDPITYAPTITTTGALPDQQKPVEDELERRCQAILVCSICGLGHNPFVNCPQQINLGQPQKPEDAEIAATVAILQARVSVAIERDEEAETLIVSLGEASELLDALSDSKRQLATMTARVEVADGQAAELDVRLSDSKREIGELKAERAKIYQAMLESDRVYELLNSDNYETTSTAKIAALKRQLEKFQSQLLTVTNELEGERKRAPRLLELLDDIKCTLTIPAAEYVPAIPQAWKLIDKALAVAGEAPADTLPDPEVARLQGELEDARTVLRQQTATFEMQNLFCKQLEQRELDLMAERDQLATRQREMREALEALNCNTFAIHGGGLTGLKKMVLAILDSPTQAQARTGEKPK